MSLMHARRCAAILALLSVSLGCKPKDGDTDATASSSGPGPEQIAAAIDATTTGMRQTSFSDLHNGDIGRVCVVVAPTPPAGARAKDAPPPIGMVRRMGPTTIYKGEIQHVSPDGLQIRAAYPTSGRYKYVDIARQDIQSIHLGN